MRFQHIAVASAIALGIVSVGIGLKVQVDRRAAKATTEPLASAPTSPAQKLAQRRTSALPESLAPNTTGAAAHNSQSVNLSIPQSPHPSTAADNQPLTAITVTPLNPAAAESAASPSIPPKPAIQSVLFNHLPYKEADSSRLQVAGEFVRGDYRRTESLDLEAANAFIIMVNEAQAQGINLIPISGFRSVAEQQELFARQTEKYGSAEAAAKLSAPAEHSEHHTGYAMDIGDGDRPEADLSPQFADTAAYQWLLNNAYVFGFEQSFPQGNAQGLNFEPWHWRYVQSERAAKVFESARIGQ